MLVLSRKTNQSLVLETLEPLPAGTRIEVHCLRIGPSSVRLGVAAPQAVHVSRAEAPPETFKPLIR